MECRPTSIKKRLTKRILRAKASQVQKLAGYSAAQLKSEANLFGGFDLNLLVLEKPETVYHTVLEQGSQYRKTAKGYGLGSGNSIPGYIPVDGFMAMIEAVKEIRFNESGL